jgi:formamidopyrimidine-DNA glycosylase
VPELPFLEVLAENLAPSVSGRRIEAIEIRQPALLQSAGPPRERFVGEYLSLPYRAGKYLVLETESRRVIVIHLMRLGRITVMLPGGAAAKAGPARAAASDAIRSRGALPKNVSARIRLDDGSEIRLLEHGTEKRARLWLAEDAESVPELARIGPDPTRGELTRAALGEALRAESRQIKTLLTDQRAIAGIGNGLSDEILYEARISPLALTSKLAEGDVDDLYAAIGSVLETQIERLRVSAAGGLPQKEPVEHYAVHDHRGRPCPRCGTAIAWISYADRETYYCPGCQTGGKVLRDRRMSKLLK